MVFAPRLSARGAHTFCLALVLWCGSSTQLDANADEYDDGAVYLDQGWGPKKRHDFYYLTQGSQLVPYTWFLAVEQADNQELFRANENLERLGYIIRPPDPRRNPDGLPIGLAKDDNPETVEMSYAMKKAFLGPNYQRENYPTTNSWLGLTCAACHTADVHFEGRVLRIDGGAAMIDQERFGDELAQALRATRCNDDKFSRFAERVLGESNNPGEAAALKKRLGAYTDVLEQAVQRNKAAFPYGFARLDAFGAILNQICETALEIPQNHRPSSAPVSLPFLWNAPRLNWVQWNGSAANPIARNVGEVMGVFAHVKLTGTPQTGQFTSTADIRNLFRLEQMVAELEAPAWPEKYLGPIDRVKADWGRQLYADNCAKCHGIGYQDDPFPMTRPNPLGRRFIRTVMVPVQEIGTDPHMVLNFVNRTARPGALRPHLPAAFRDLTEVPAAILLGTAVQGVIQRQLKGMRPPLDRRQLAELTGFRTPNLRVPNPAAYKARPLDGIWATAPYLHCGSVPNLYQLLLPARERMRSFYVGSRQFDPLHVGFATDAFEGGFLFRTQTTSGQPIPGNSNAGHEGKYYTQLRAGNGRFREFTDDERWALVEYMKTLK